MLVVFCCSLLALLDVSHTKVIKKKCLNNFDHNVVHKLQRFNLLSNLIKIVISA